MTIHLPRGHTAARAATFSAFLALTAHATPAAAFDTRWHLDATATATEMGRGFSVDAGRLLMFGTFSPDFFGPLYDSPRWVPSKLKPWTPRFGRFLSIRNEDGSRGIRRAAIFLHFDDLHDGLESNERFGLLFDTLLANTQRTIGELADDAKLDDRAKKIAILLTIGASLHMIQDFYSHTTWTHLDLPPPEHKQLTHPLLDGGHAIDLSAWLSNKRRVRTWYEAVDALGPPRGWRLRVQSGTYPNPTFGSKRTDEGVPKTHEHMNHDNSHLWSDDRSQIEHHRRGVVSAEKSPSEHQQIAVATATFASFEWLAKIESDPKARHALASARNVSFPGPTPWSRDDFAGGLAAAQLLSCATEHWDGPLVEETDKLKCQSTEGAAIRRFLSTRSLHDVPDVLPSPSAELWRMFLDLHLLERLATGFMSDGETYGFSGDATKPASILPDAGVTSPRPQAQRGCGCTVAGGQSTGRAAVVTLIGVALARRTRRRGRGAHRAR